MYNKTLECDVKKKYKFIKLLALVMASMLLLSACNLLVTEPSVDLAEDLVKDGDIDQAVEMYEELLDEDDEDYEAWFGLVEAYMEDDEWEDAADTMGDLAEIIEDNYDAEDENHEDILEDFFDLAEEILAEDEDVEITGPELEEVDIETETATEDEEEVDRPENEEADSPSEDTLIDEETTDTLSDNLDSSDELISLGLIAPTSGDLAVYGQAVENGARLAVEMVNDNFGINGQMIEMFTYDNKADTLESINGLNYLVDQYDIVGLIGPVLSSTSLTVGPLAEIMEMPMISPTATNINVALGYDFVYKASFSDDLQGNLAAKFVEDLGIRNVSIIYDSGDAYSEALYEGFNNHFDYLVNDFTNYGYNDTPDMIEDWLYSVIDSETEAIYIPLYFDSAGPLVEMINEIAPDMIIIGGDGFDGIEEIYPNTFNVYYTNHFSSLDTGSSYLAEYFYNNYELTYGDEPNALSALAFDTTMIMIAAIEEAESTDSYAIINALNNISIDGATGSMSFDGDGNPIKGAAITAVNNGNASFWGWISLN